MKMIFLCLALASLSSWAGFPKTTYYASLVLRGSVELLIDRLPQGEMEVVLTSIPVLNALASVPVAFDQGQHLYAVALDGESISTLDFEVARIGNYAFLAQRGIESSHLHLTRNSDLKPMLLSDTETRWKWDAPISFLRSLTDTELKAVYSHLQTSFDQEFLKDRLKKITGETDVVIEGRTQRITERKSNAGRTAVRKFLAQELQAMGFQTSLSPYGSNGAANLVAQKDGTDRTKFVMLSAHLDSVGNAGADDDGTGLVALLATAKAFSSLRMTYGLRIVGFDEEEKGLVGSGEYFKTIRANNDVNKLVSGVHYDMIGYDSDDDGSFHILDCNENTSPRITQMMQRSLSVLAIELRNIPACRNRSDHIRYWQAGKPAVMTIEVREQNHDTNPCYHQACDKVDTINFSFLEKMIHLGALSLAEMIQVQM